MQLYAQKLLQGQGLMHVVVIIEDVVDVDAVDAHVVDVVDVDAVDAHEDAQVAHVADEDVDVDAEDVVADVVNCLD